MTQYKEFITFKANNGSVKYLGNQVFEITEKSFIDSRDGTPIPFRVKRNSENGLWEYLGDGIFKEGIEVNYEMALTLNMLMDKVSSLKQQKETLQ